MANVNTADCDGLFTRIDSTLPTKQLPDRYLSNKDADHDDFRDTNELSSLLHTLPKLKKEAKIYHHISEYANGGQRDEKFGIKVKAIYDVDVNELTSNNVSKRMLLWHGTLSKHIPSILLNGLKIPKPGGNQRFGPGIYFADRVSKSAIYCCESQSQTPIAGTHGYLLLCEVEVGDPFPVKVDRKHFMEPPRGFDSIKAVGKNGPDLNESVDYKGICIPLGKTLREKELVPLDYNEYVVYSEEKVKIMYLVEFEFISKTNH